MSSIPTGDVAAPTPEHEMDIATHIGVIDKEAHQFVAAADRAGLDATVPSCPGWDVRTLVRHLSEIHLWAAAHVARRATSMWPEDLDDLTRWWPQLAVFWPDDDALPDHYLATNENLVRELRDAPPDVAAMSFLPAASPLAMWARRQAHELTIHRVDAEQAAGEQSTVDDAVATDGIDELLMAFAPRPRSLPLDADRTMAVHTTDTDHDWRVVMGPDGIVTTRQGGPADATLSGTAAELYLALWNRERGDITITGDEDVLTAWSSNHRVRWD